MRLLLIFSPKRCRSSYHPEECFVSEVDVLVDGGQNAEDETDKNCHKTAANKQQAQSYVTIRTSDFGRQREVCVCVCVCVLP